MRSGADQNGDNLRINRVCRRISDHCRVTVRVRAGYRVRIKVRVSITVLGLGSGLQIVVYKLLEKATKCRSVT